MYPNLNGNLLSRGFSFLKSIPFAEVLDGTSKTLGVINQAIPVYYQVKPIIQNVGTVFKISNALKNSNEESIPDASNTHNSTIFFV